MGLGRASHASFSGFPDKNVYTAAKEREKLRYMHRNPVKRGLVSSPDQWRWSSFLHHLTGVEGAIEIESLWTARKRERLGIVHTFLRPR